MKKIEDETIRHVRYTLWERVLAIFGGFIAGIFVAWIGIIIGSMVTGRNSGGVNPFFVLCAGSFVGGLIGLMYPKVGKVMLKALGEAFLSP